MKKMIAYCGLVCSNCPTFLATQNDDDVAREKTAALYSRLYGFDLKPEDINCDGCLTVGGRLLGYCKTCEIKQCCSKRSLENCAHCDERQCEKLIGFHNFSEEAKACYDALKKEIGK
ncbi:MAG: DUF3795 domain-containing protein [Bacillota bacterium]